jgi:low affinity Fe/Cu permease
MFGYSDTSQLVINTGASVVTFLMVFLIQSTQNRDGAAIHAKLERGARGYPCVNANFDSDLS